MEYSVGVNRQGINSWADVKKGVSADYEQRLFKAEWVAIATTTSSSHDVQFLPETSLLYFVLEMLLYQRIKIDDSRTFL